MIQTKREKKFFVSKDWWKQKQRIKKRAIESLKYGFEKLNLKEIGAAADINHIASNRILQKIGLKFIETFNYDGVTHNWYNMVKTDWTELK